MKKELKFMLLGIYLALLGLIFLFLEGHSFHGVGFLGIAGIALPAVSLLIFLRGFTSDFKKDE